MWSIRKRSSADISLPIIILTIKRPPYGILFLPSPPPSPHVGVRETQKKKKKKKAEYKKTRERHQASAKRRLSTRDIFYKKGDNWRVGVSEGRF